MLDPKEQQRLEDYLLQIEKHLQQISVTDRSDILLELNSHINESLAGEQTTLEQVLRSLGEPQLVANRYLLAKGAKPIPPKKFSWLKALTLSTIAIMSLAVIAIVMVVKSFTPLISVNEEKGRVVILGGLIDINEQQGKVSLGKGLIKIDDDYDHDDFEVKLSLQQQKIKGDLPVEKNSQVVIDGQNAKMSFKPSDDQTLSYKCSVDGVGEPVDPKNIINISDRNKISFNFSNNILRGSKCKFKIPQNSQLTVNVGNGKLEFKELAQQVNVKMNNGKINFKKDRSQKYNINAVVKNGMIYGHDNYEKDTEGHLIDLEVENGMIKFK